MAGNAQVKNQSYMESVMEGFHDRCAGREQLCCVFPFTPLYIIKPPLF